MLDHEEWEQQRAKRAETLATLQNEIAAMKWRTQVKTDAKFEDNLNAYDKALLSGMKISWV